MSKILYLVPGNMDKSELQRRQHIAQRLLINPSSNEVCFVSSDNGPISIESSVEEAMSVPGMIHTYYKMKEEYAAVIIGCAGDPGIVAMRELLTIPVVGPFQSSIALSTTLGHSYGVISILDELNPATILQLRGLGYDNTLTGIKSIDCKVLDMSDGVTPEAEILDAITKKTEEFAEEGASSVVLGCMTLAFLLVDEKLKNRVTIPIINPAKVAINTAELLISSGLCHSKLTYPIPDMSKLYRSVLNNI